MPPALAEKPKGFIRWWLFDIGGRTARVGSTSYDVVWPCPRHQAELEKAYQGRLIGLLLEPFYIRDDCFDPEGGFFWEDEYPASTHEPVCH